MKSHFKNTAKKIKDEEIFFKGLVPEQNIIENPEASNKQLEKKDVKASQKSFYFQPTQFYCKDKGEEFQSKVEPLKIKEESSFTSIDTSSTTAKSDSCIEVSVSDMDTESHIESLGAVVTHDSTVRSILMTENREAYGIRIPIVMQRGSQKVLKIGYYCDFCSFKSRTKQLLKEHMVAQHIMNCSKCSYTTLSRLNLLRHMERVHDHSQQSEVFDVCTLDFSPASPFEEPSEENNSDQKDFIKADPEKHTTVIEKSDRLDMFGFLLKKMKLEKDMKELGKCK